MSNAQHTQRKREQEDAIGHSLPDNNEGRAFYDINAIALGAMGVATHNVPEHSIWGGVPAKELKRKQY